MIPIRPHGSICGAVNRATGIIVNDGLIAEIDNVERTVRTCAHLNGTKPEILAANELCFFPAGFLSRCVSHARRLEIEMTDDVDGGLGREIAVVPLGWPCPSLVDDGSSTSRVPPDLIDLDIGLLLPAHGGHGRRTRKQAMRAGDTRQLALGEDVLGEDNLNERVPCCGLCEKHFAL